MKIYIVAAKFTKINILLFQFIVFALFSLIFIGVRMKVKGW